MVGEGRVWRGRWDEVWRERALLRTARGIRGEAGEVGGEEERGCDGGERGGVGGG